MKMGRAEGGFIIIIIITIFIIMIIIIIIIIVIIIIIIIIVVKNNENTTENVNMTVRRTVRHRGTQLNFDSHCAPHGAPPLHDDKNEKNWVMPLTKVYPRV